MTLTFTKRIGALLAGAILATSGCGGSDGDGPIVGGAPAGFHATVVLPEALRNGGPAGFGTTVSDIQLAATLDGVAVTPNSVQWSITDAYGLWDPPADVTPSPATGTTTSFAIPDFETVRTGANAWLNGLYGIEHPAHELGYIQAPERKQLLSFGKQQVQAMSFKVVARVTYDTHTATASALVSPVTVSNGGNTQPLGMMVVANAPSTATNAWTLTYLPTNAAEGAAFGAPPEGVTLQGADTKNPYVVPTVTGVYRLQNGVDDPAPLLFRVSTYHGAGMADTDEGTDGISCADCHSGVYALTDKFTEWAASPHARHGDTGKTLFELGLTGALGPSYSEAALASHVVGYSKVPTAQNRGFDDVMGGWTFPAPAAGNWAALPQALKYRAGVQCESCHGPLEPTDHSMVDAIGHGPVQPAASMDSGICMSCHDTMEQDQGTLWATTRHANTELAMEEIGSASCARCHGAEGFVKYLARQQTNAVPGSWGNMTTAEMEGLSPETVHSISCQTCHDPHSTELRLTTGNTQTVAGMFALTDVGSGALCIVCHNSRSGAIKQGTYAITSLQRLGPHHSAQGDMLAGRNAFFMPNLLATDGATTLPYLSAHARVADTCVRCHVKSVPEDIQQKYMIAASNHTFKTSKQVCATCHAGSVGDTVEASITAKMEALNARIGAIISAKLLQPGGFDTAAGQRTDPETGAPLPDPASRTVLPTSVRSITTSMTVGAVIVELTDDSRFQVTLDRLHRVGTTTALLTISEANTQTVAKAYFNLLYVDFDGSKGFHNPAFAAEVLDRSLAALPGTVVIP